MSEEHFNIFAFSSQNSKKKESSRKSGSPRTLRRNWGNIRHEMAQFLFWLLASVAENASKLPEREVTIWRKVVTITSPRSKDDRIPLPKIDKL